MENLQYIEITRLHPHPGNPRKDLGDLTELADSIKAQGVLQNLTVVPLVDLDDPDASVGNEQYTVIIGHRRLAAAALAGLDKLPCVVVDMDQKQQARTMLMENMQRSDLTVYEQAQGFQMMLDLGDTVEDIAQQSGFSTTTVRRRLKMMELDQDTLKEVSGRQLSIMDFDKLAEIEDIKARNECLEKIGTADFERNISWKLREQAEKKNRPAVMKFLKDIKAKEISNNEAWSHKYDQIGSNVYIAEWGPEKVKLPDDKGEQVYFNMRPSYFSLHIKRKKAPPVKKTSEELARGKVLREAHKAMKEMAIKAYTARAAFAKGLTVTKANERDILFGALLAMGNTVNYDTLDRDKVKKILGVPTTYHASRYLDVIDAITKVERSKTPELIYSMLNDSEELGNFSTYKGDYPIYAPSAQLRAVYAWLVPLGYEMSDEEKMLQDGTHPLYKDPDKKEKNNGTTD